MDYIYKLRNVIPLWYTVSYFHLMRTLKIPKSPGGTESTPLVNFSQICPPFKFGNEVKRAKSRFCYAGVFASEKQGFNKYSPSIFIYEIMLNIPANLCVICTCLCGNNKDISHIISCSLLNKCKNEERKKIYC